MNPCILCSSTAFHPIHQKQKWKYLQCQNCGLVIIDPKPSNKELLRGYNTYLPEVPEEIKNWENMMQPVIKKSAQIIQKETGKGGGCLLDVGSGYGFFLKEMHTLGWDVEGVELSKTGREYTCRNGRISVHALPLESLRLPENNFDVVTLFYVIEHLPDPVTTIKEIFRILKPGGMILLRWPHSAPIAKLLGPFSKALDLFHTPFHLYDFSPRTIRLLLETAPFDRIETLIGGYSIPQNRLNHWSSIITGFLAEGILKLSGKKLLLPGVSKTTVAHKKKGHA